MTIYWGNIGAGILFTSENQTLLILRSPYILQPLTWGIPGGSVNLEHEISTRVMEEAKLDEKEIWEGALREVEEELGNLPTNLHPYDKLIYRDNNFQFHIYFVEVPPEIKNIWEMELDDFEVADAKWFNKTTLLNWTELRPLHFGMKYITSQRPNLFTEKRQRRYQA